MPSYKDLKEYVWEQNMQIPKLGLAIYSFGNASAIDRHNGVFAIKPSGIPYEKLTPRDMVVVDFETKIVEGNLQPSSDTKTHAVLYKNFPEISKNQCEIFSVLNVNISAQINYMLITS
jgi:L-ribulose-5-phosphate 4-epimerase